MLSDEELIALFQGGNPEAFDIIVGKFKNPLMNFIYRFTSNSTESEDIVQETFVKVFVNKHSYKPIAKFSTWIYTIAANLAKTQLRRKARITFFSSLSKKYDGEEIEFEDKNYNLDSITNTVMMDEIIQKALDRIPLKYREAVVLRDIQDLPYEEIATITGTNIGTVKSRINRGRDMLRKYLKVSIDE